MRLKRSLKIGGIGVGGIAVVAALTITIAGGAFLPHHYLDPWKKTYYQRFTDPRMQVVAHGLLAANSHNMQPWKIQLDTADPGVFRLFTDGERLTTAVDPVSRQITISQGTFLEYGVIAAAKLGYRCDLHLFPQGEYDEQGTPASMAEKPVAEVRLQPGSATSGSEAASPSVRPLYDCLFFPDTVRTAYADAPLTDDQVARLQRSAPELSVEVNLLQRPGDLQYLGQLAIAGSKVEGAVRRISDESGAIFRGTEYAKNKYRYGFSVEGQGTTGFGKWLTEGLLALMPSLAAAGDTNQRFVDQTTDQVEHTPAYVLILTNDNSRSSQVRAGMAYARLQLTAESLGLAVQPLSQVLEEYPEMAALRSQVHAKYAPNGQTIQMLIRVGRPTGDVPRSMRRDATDLLMD